MSRRTISLRSRATSICVLTLILAWSGGCRLTLDFPLSVSGSALSNVNGWDLSACGQGGFFTCAELFADNENLILGGRTTGEIVLQGVVGFFSALSQIEVEVGNPPG